jgi:hypothetical protein
MRCSTRADGDFHLHGPTPVDLERRRRALVDLPWTMLDQTHGVERCEVERPGAHDRSVGDVAATGVVGAVLGCWAADCAPVVVVGELTRIAVAHAGWRGLAAGVIDVAVRSCREPIDRVVLGPVIGPCCYEFDVDHADAVAARLGLAPRAVRGVTSWGTPSLDVPAIVAALSARHEAPLFRFGGCTGCGDRWFSHRVRRDRCRHVLAAWQEAS